MGRISEACRAVLLSFAVVLSVSSGAMATIYGAISGRVIAEDTGQGVGGLSVLALAMSPGSRVHHYATTDANGIYVLNDLEPDTYAVSFNETDSPYLFDLESLQVTLPVGKNVVNANYVLKLGGSVSGAVYDSDGVTPLTNVWVSARVQDSQTGALEGFKAALTTDDGRFLLRGLPQTDSCVMQLSVPGHAVLSKNVKITAGSTTPDVNFLLKRDDITGVTGHVTSSLDGAAIVEAEIALRDSSGNEIGNAYTDAAGGYSIIGVPPGVYSATAYWPTGEFAGLHKEDITVTSGTQVSLDFQFSAPSPQTPWAGWTFTDLGAPFSARAPSGFYPDYPDPMIWLCNESQTDKIKRAFNRIKQWLKFDPCMGPAMRNRLKAKLTQGIELWCVSKTSDADCDGETWAYTHLYDYSIYLCKEKSLSTTTPEWCLESTILHELAHTVGYSTEYHPMACEKACFPACKVVQTSEYNPYNGCSCE